MKTAVMIPAYNCENTIQKCIDSIKNQTYKDWITITVDDKSTDNTGKILIENECENIHIYENEYNLGCVRNRNAIIKMILDDYPGVDYVAIQDADDWSEPERLEKQIEFLNNNPDHGLCGTFYFWHEVKNNTSGKHGLLEKDEDIRAKQYFKSVMCHGSFMIRKKVYEDVGIYDPYFTWSHDNDWLTRLLYQNKWKVATIPHFLYHVWVTPYTHSKTPERLLFRQKNRYKRYCESVGIEYDERNFEQL